jgi:glycosyltransferase involved in cell wall biosynthesis
MPAKISLCMIVGNVEEYIRRCLSSFKPIADEICVVRAIGNQVPDKTLDIARDEFGARVGEYKNESGKEGWPHVDNFAAARQQSFDMATGDYCFWCDSDDVLEAGAEFIREHADRGGYPLFLFPYKIFGRGVTLPRERMTIRDGGKWKFPVHECYTFPMKVEGVQDDRVIVTHLPHLSKTGSNDRNLRILESIPESEMTAGLWYHLYGALASSGKKAQAVEAAKKAIAHPDIGRPEKYELFLDLANLSEKPEVKSAFLHQAHAVDPNRREALGLLTCNALDYGKNVDALAYARQMMATTKPAGESWNDRQAAYDWLGIDIFTQALRMNGFKDEANHIRRQALHKQGGATISLIHATRGRAKKASIARKMWLDMAEHPERIEHIFVFDADDEDSYALRRMHHLEINAGGGCVAAWNNGAMATEAPVMIQMSDDWMPPPKWDTLILERMGDLQKPSVLAISDGSRKDNLLCMVICTRNYWAQDFFMFNPRFTGVYSDNLFTDIAYQRGRVIDAKDLVFDHQHPAFGKADVDETYAKQNSREAYAKGLAIYEDLKAHPERDFSSIPGFCNFWPFYVELASRMCDGDTFVEVGVWLGRSIVFLAQELKRQRKKVSLIAVDTFKGEQDQPDHVAYVEQAGGSIRSLFEENIKRCGVADMITIIEGDSAESASKLQDKSCFGVFIDAAHDTESVKRDIQAWLPKVQKFGIICGHDADYKPVVEGVAAVIPDAKLLGCVWAKTFDE